MSPNEGNSIFGVKVCNILKSGISSEGGQFTTSFKSEIHYEVVCLVCLEFIFPIESKKKKKIAEDNCSNKPQE